MALSESIIPVPFLKDIRAYSGKKFFSDLLAAFSVAMMALPQAMACAFVADLPVSAGIFSAIFGTIFASAFGSSRVLVTGPSNTLAILILSGTADILYSYYRDVSGPQREWLTLQIILQTALLMGGFQILAGWLKMGRITQFASRSVVVGYVAGAAFTIVVSQLFSFTGIPENGGIEPLYQRLIFFFSHLNGIHPLTLSVGIFCLIIIMFSHRLSPKIPGAAIAFFLATLAVQFFGWDKAPGVPGGVALLEDFGPARIGWPQFEWPAGSFQMFLRVMPLAVALTVLSAIEATTIGRLYFHPDDPPYSDNQEIFGLGVSNVVCAFVGAMPNSGSFSRTALNIAVGVRTRFGSIFSGVFVFLFVLLIGNWIEKIPLAALSALLFFAAYAMVDVRELVTCIKATLTDGFVVMGTFCSTLLFPLDVSFYIGVGLSILFYLKQTAVPRFVEYTFTNLGKLRPMDAGDDRPDPRICILQAEGELFFGAAEPLLMKIRQISEEESLKVIVLQLLNVRHIDASACLTLRKAAILLKNQGKVLMISGVLPEVEVVMQHAGLIDQVGIERIYKANERLPSEPTRRAYADAKVLLG